MHTTHTDDHNGVVTINYRQLIAKQLGLENLVTKNNKEIDVVKNTRGDFLIRFKSGGQQPKEFEGKFTTIKACCEAITKYLTKKEDAKTESSKATN